MKLRRKYEKKCTITLPTDGRFTLNIISNDIYQVIPKSGEGGKFRALKMKSRSKCEKYSITLSNDGRFTLKHNQQ